MIKPKILTVLNEDFYPINKGYRKVGIDRLNLLSNYYDLDLFVPQKKRSELISSINEKINVFKYNKKIFGSMVGFLSSILKINPISVSIYTDLSYRKFVEKKTLNTKYDYVYLITPRGIGNLNLKKISYKKLIIDFVDPQSATFNYRSKKIHYLSILYYFEYKLFLKFENKISRIADSILLISQKDKQIYKKKFKKVYCVPHIKKINNSIVKYKNRNKNSFCFSGNLSYEENIISITFIIKKILPILRKYSQNYKLHIIGSNPSNKLQKLLIKNEIKVILNPKNILYEISKYKLAIAPKTIPFGVISKIPECISVGTPILTTKENISNSSIENYNENLLAETADEFAMKIHLILSGENIFFDNLKLINEYALFFSESKVKNLFCNHIFSIKQDEKK